MMTITDSLEKRDSPSLSRVKRKGRASILPPVIELSKITEEGFSGGNETVSIIYVSLKTK